MNIGVFCSSSDKLDSIYIENARILGELIVENKWNLVYGGTNCGLMQEIANTVLNSESKVLGVIPECIIKKGVAAQNISELITTPDMKERKSILREKSDAFIALPGGWGTLEEITEVITLKQLGQLDKPIVFIDVEGFYQYFFLFINTITKQGFVSEAYKNLYEVVETPEEAVEYIKNYDYREVESKY